MYFETRNFMSNPSEQLLLCVLDGHGENGKRMAEIPQQSWPGLLADELKKRPATDYVSRKAQLTACFARAHTQLLETHDAEMSGECCCRPSLETRPVQTPC